MTLPANLADVLHARIVDADLRILYPGWDPVAVLPDICALANDAANRGGGYIVVGLDSTSEGEPILPPRGLSTAQIEQVREEVVRLGGMLRPEYTPLFSECSVDGRGLVVLWIPGGTRRPYTAQATLESNREYVRHVRRGNRTVVPSSQEWDALISMSKQVPFDSRTRLSAGVDDLERSRIISFLHETRSELASSADSRDTTQLCDRMRLIERGEAGDAPVNAALMFFARNPGRFFSTMRIEIAVFPPAGRGNYTSAVFDGPLHEQLEGAVDFIRVHAVRDLAGTSMDGTVIPRSSYPLTAIREALTNAVRHRGYDPGEPIEVQVFPDQIRVTSTPGPDRAIALESLLAGTVRARPSVNRRVDEMLAKLGLIERRGSGMARMRQALRANGSAELWIETDRARSYMTVVIPSHPYARVPAERPRSRRTAPRRDPRGGSEPIVPMVERSPGADRYPGSQRDEPPRNTESEQPPLPDMEWRLLHFCREPRDRRSIQRHLNVPGRELRREYLDPLVEARLLIRSDPWTPGSRSERFHTSGAGFGALRRGHSKAQ
jgi:ATP-dependent DNA helicase RecG